MSRDALLHRQRALVDAIGASHDLGQASTSLPAALAGIDAGRLSLLARLTHAKRLAKVAHVLPATISALRADLPALFQSFARDLPMRSAHGLANALQFWRFLRRLERHGGLRNAFVADLAACECALAVVSLRQPDGTHAQSNHCANGPLLARKTPGVALLACAYDLRDLLATGSGEARWRQVHLAFVPHTDTPPRVFEVDAAVFAWLRMMRSWQRHDGYEATALLEQLERSHIVQLRHDV